MNWKIGVDIHTLICIKWITSKNLLHKKNKIQNLKKKKKKKRTEDQNRRFSLDRQVATSQEQTHNTGNRETQPETSGTHFTPARMAGPTKPAETSVGRRWRNRNPYTAGGGVKPGSVLEKTVTVTPRP